MTVAPTRTRVGCPRLSSAAQFTRPFSTVERQVTGDRIGISFSRDAGRTSRCRRERTGQARYSFRAATDARHADLLCRVPAHGIGARAADQPDDRFDHLHRFVTVAGALEELLVCDRIEVARELFGGPPPSLDRSIAT